MTITGDHFLGARRIGSERRFCAVNPATDEPLQGDFSEGTKAQIAEMAALAGTASPAYEALPLKQRALFLDAIAEEIDALGEPLLARANLETALPLARLTTERARTTTQLRLFAQEVRDGTWQGLRHDPALPGRTPAPRPDISLRKKAIGPVAIFGASNFPLAFSVAGGDTAAALAAGCPVIAKGHPAHPGTCELIASAIIAAAARTGMPDGVFSLIQGEGHEVGGALVTAPQIRAVGFTGSRAGGLALQRLAQARPVPIPLYAEMSAINPTILLPAALDEDAAGVAGGFIGSLTMGAGQFCTNPGLLLAIAGPELEAFKAAAAAAIQASPPQTMLTRAIYRAYSARVEALAKAPGIDTIAMGADGDAPNMASPALFAVAAAAFMENASLSEEVFGPAALIVECKDADELKSVLLQMEGQLTASLQIAPADQDLAADLVPLLEDLAGRIIVNGWPTGVEVCPAMVHGGPYPATTDGRTTAVGTLAIDRFLRPVCYQNFPEALLPTALR